MLYNSVFLVLVAIIAASFALERWLDYLNRKAWSPQLPKELSDVYDPEQYRKQQEYKKANDKFSLLTSTFNFIIVMLMLFLGGFHIVNQWAGAITQNDILIVLVFFGILAIASDLITTPFSLYDTFVIEERFGFNRTTPRTFILDKIKGWLLALIIGGGLLALFVWFYQLSGRVFWLYTWMLATAFTVFMAMFSSSLIVPLFNKQTPLEEGELRDAIEAFSTKAGFKLRNIFVIDGSRRSTKANAYFTGLGPKKRIVLYDTLIKDLTQSEIVAVIAHEIGHYKKKHIITSIVSQVFQTGLTLFILSRLISYPALSIALGDKEASFHLGLIAFGILYSPISLVAGLLMNHVSRKNEYEADRFVKLNHHAGDLISGLKKLTSKNLGNLTPHPLYVFFHYSHPTLLQRIKKLRS
jgi:STE24 endopeptidase